MTTPISKVVSIIQFDSSDEALDAVDLVTVTGRKAALMHVHLSGKFKVNVSVNRNAVVLVTAGRKPVHCTPEAFLPALKRYIYEVDEAMRGGAYTPLARTPALSPCRLPAPAHMDIPVWDHVAGRWYDAEY